MQGITVYVGMFSGSFYMANFANLCRLEPKSSSPKPPKSRHAVSKAPVRTGPATPQGRTHPKHAPAAAAAAAATSSASATSPPPPSHAVDHQAGARQARSAASVPAEARAPRRGARPAPAPAAAKASREPAGSGVDPAEWARLQGIQRRIEALIGGYTHGASRRPSFLRHFDRDRAPPAALATAGGGSSSSDDGGGGGDDGGDAESDEGESTVQLAEQEAARDRSAFLSL